MSEYLHGAYGVTQANGNRVSDTAQSVIVAIGTAPVHQLSLGDGESYNVNKPVLVRNIAEAKAAFGYSSDWENYTLCEAMHHFFENEGIGPLVLINVLDPTTHKSGSQTSASLTPTNNRVTIASAQEIILETVVVSKGSTELTKGTDYTIAYNISKQTIEIVGITDLGTSALTVRYYSVTPASVTDAVVIGATDDAGTNTGVYAIKNVYPLTGAIPAYIIAPGFSSHPAVHEVIAANSKKINGHWDAWMFTDIPILDGSTAVTIATAAAWKTNNGYDNENETVCFPMVAGTDGKYYHLSVIRAANFLEQLLENDSIPYHSASNTDADIVESLWLGSADTKVYDDQIINESLNKNGITSAAFVGGRWAVWGAHAADYNQTDADDINVAETNRMMLYYLSNDFQMRRPTDADTPMSANDLRSIVAEEQARLDALVNMGALLYGEASISAENISRSDVLRGDFVFEFRVTTTPLAKSLTALVAWVDDGFAVYYADNEIA